MKILACTYSPALPEMNECVEPEGSAGPAVSTSTQARVVDTVERAGPRRAASGSVLLCRGPAFGVNPTLARVVGFEHWYLRHGALAAGMGSVRRTADHMDTEMSDNRWRLSLGTDRCSPVTELFPEHGDLDLECVDRMMRPGRPLGHWGIDGTCQDAVVDILETCDLSARSRRGP